MLPLLWMAPDSRRRTARLLPIVGYCNGLLLAFLLLLPPGASAFRPALLSLPRAAATRMEAAAADGEESLLSPILGQVATSKTIEIHALTKAMEARGEELVSLCVGEPDFPPPPGLSLVA